MQRFISRARAPIKMARMTAAKQVNTPQISLCFSGMQALNQQNNFVSINFCQRNFSTDNQKLNDAEIIEYVEGKVFEVLKSAAKCNHEKLARTATFEDLGFDSLDGVELVLAMEEHFGFDITNNEAEKVTSVMDAIQIFHANVLKRSAVTTTDENKNE